MRSRTLSVTFLLMFVSSLLLIAPPAGVQAFGVSQQEQQPTTPPPAQRRRRPRQRQQPRGAQACIDRLIALAANDPLVPYEGEPQRIINNGLLWDNEKSRCSIGSDPALRRRVADLAAKWRAKDAAAVRSELQEIKSAAPST